MKPIFGIPQRVWVAGMLIGLLQTPGGMAMSMAQEPVTDAEPSSSSLDQLEQTEAMAMQQEIQRMHDALEAMQSTYNQRLQEMQTTIDTLKAQIQKGPPLTTSTVEETTLPPDDAEIGEALVFGEDEPLQSAAPTSPLSPTGSNLLSGTTVGSTLGRAFQNFNPDISVLGDFLGNFNSRSGTEGRNRFGMRETEIALQAVIDPFVRADFFLTKPEEEEFEIEEGYVTLLSLPFGLQGKVGKFRSPIGRLNRIHGPELPQVDRPDVITQFFGEEGLAETAISLSKILPTPWFSSVEMQLGNGDNETLFGYGRFTKPLLVSHWSNFFELSPTHNIQMGLSGAFGSRADEARYTGIQGLDLTYRWIPPKMGRSLVWTTELLNAQLESPVEGPDNLFGMYSFLEYQLSRRWFAGLRFDYTQIPAVANASLCAVSPYLDYWQSEFGRFRLQYKHTFGNGLPSSDQLWAQYTVTLGTHRPHPF